MLTGIDNQIPKELNLVASKYPKITFSSRALRKYFFNETKVKRNQGWRILQDCAKVEEHDSKETKSVETKTIHCFRFFVKFLEKGFVYLTAAAAERIGFVSKECPTTVYNFVLFKLLYIVQTILTIARIYKYFTILLHALMLDGKKWFMLVGISTVDNLK